MKKIRRNVFETNSSSSHAASIPKGNERFAANMEASQTGVLTLYAGDYNWEWYRYYTPEEKLRYLLTQASQDFMFEGNKYAQALISAYENATGITVLTMESEGSIDHESVGVGSDICMRPEEDITEFLFNNKSYIETGNDNDSVPARINSDIGMVEYCDDLIAKTDEVEGMLEFKIKIEKSEIGSTQIVFDNDIIFTDGNFDELKTRILKEGVLNNLSQRFYSVDVMEFNRNSGLRITENLSKKMDDPKADYVEKTEYGSILVSKELAKEIIQASIEFGLPAPIPQEFKNSVIETRKPRKRK